MKLLHTIVLILILHNVIAQNRYFLVLGDKDQETSWEKAQGSNVWVSFDSETGALEGSYLQKALQGTYNVKKVSAGMVKGFFVSTQLGYLQRDVTMDTEYIAFTEFLASAKRFYLYPDVLIDPKWHFIEIINTDENKTMLFVKKH